MDFTLLFIVVTLGISTVLNLFLKKFGISQIIGYILTGAIIYHLFDAAHMISPSVLEHIGDFGIVFLMFTIGLEISLSKMSSMKTIIFTNGFLQVAITTVVFFLIDYYIFDVDMVTAIIISLAFSLSSTAIVLSYLKSSKEIYNPYGQKATGILIFQDIAVIPILIFLGFMTTNDQQDISTVLINTIISAIVVISLLFIVGKRVMTYLLHFSASSEIDELFMGSVLFIVISASLLASFMGFTYSLGAFVAGMIIAETKYHRKVETDIAPFKDLLLGTFFIVVGMKIDVGYFLEHIWGVIDIFAAVFIIKTFVVYIVLRLTSSHVLSLKSSLALSQVGEFSFVIFAIASSSGLLNNELELLLVLVVIFSMIITPFFISKINSFVSFMSRHHYLEPVAKSFEQIKNHVIICGYSDLGKQVANNLDLLGAKYVIIDNNPKHIQEALNEAKEAYLGDMSKPSLQEAINIDYSASVIVTLDNINKKRAICEAVLKNKHNINLVVKVSSKQERKALEDLAITAVVDDKIEIGRMLVEKMITCNIGKR